jgi:hypothetical protein
LKNPLTHKLVREVLFPMLRERPELRETPHLVEREFNACRRAIEEDARRKSKLDEHKAKIQAGAMAAGEQPIVAFGEPLWPPQRPDLTSPYSYKELCHACWFVGYSRHRAPWLEADRDRDGGPSNNIGSVCLWLKRRLGHLGHLERFRVPAAPIAVPKRSSVYPTVELTGRQPKRQ